MKEKLSRQLPGDTIGVWAWDKMRDVVSASYTRSQNSPHLGPKERHVVVEVGAVVLQIAVVLVKVPGSKGFEIICAFPNLQSKWSRSTVNSLVQFLNAKSS